MRIIEIIGIIGIVVIIMRSGVWEEVVEKMKRIKKGGRSSKMARSNKS